MSKNYISPAQMRVLNDVRRLSTEELMKLYGIELSEEGKVFDPVENKQFEDLTEWAMYVGALDDEDNFSTFSKISANKISYDDEY